MLLWSSLDAPLHWESVAHARHRRLSGVLGIICLFLSNSDLSESRDREKETTGGCRSGIGYMVDTRQAVR